MRLLVNLATLKKGGGQNVALNFLQYIVQKSPKDFEFVFVVSESSDIRKFLESQNQEIIIVNDNPLKRMLTEIFQREKIIQTHKIDLIYTYFGIGLYPKKVLQLSGSADSNLFFPEIDFWKHYNGMSKIKKKLIDAYRTWGLKRASAVVFENEKMMERGKKLFNLEKVVFIPPSFSTPTEHEPTNFENDNIPKGLLLCGWQRNKNFMLIPEIAKDLKEKGIKFKFLISTSADESIEYKSFKRLVDKLQIEDMIQLIGTVEKTKLPDLFSKIDFVFLLSNLESFSNNIIEAYYYQKPLIISKLEWAKSICGEAAQYVDLNNISDISNKVITLIENEEEVRNLIGKQTEKLKTFPSIAEKSELELNYLKKLYESA